MYTAEQQELLRDETMIFGKYNGKPLKRAVEDKNYCQWLCKQDWLAEWPYIHKVMKSFHPDLFPEKVERKINIFKGMEKFVKID